MMLIILEVYLIKVIKEECFEIVVLLQTVGCIKHPAFIQICTKAGVLWAMLQCLFSVTSFMVLHHFYTMVAWSLIKVHEVM